MFDIATRTPTTGRTPFDLQLLTPLPASAYAWHDFATADGEPITYAEQLRTFALGLEPTLQTAIVLSLFTDRRAGPDDALPAGVTDRRGWVGEEFVGDGEPWGSLLWLLYTGKATADVLERARFAAQEALDWMVRDGVASRVVVTAEWVAAEGAERLAIRPQIYQGDDAAPVYDVLWGTSLRRGGA